MDADFGLPADHESFAAWLQGYRKLHWRDAKLSVAEAMSRIDRVMAAETWVDPGRRESR